MAGSESTQNKRVVCEKLISIAPKSFNVGAERSSISSYRLAVSEKYIKMNYFTVSQIFFKNFK